MEGSVLRAGMHLLHVWDVQHHRCCEFLPAFRSHMLRMSCLSMTGAKSKHVLAQVKLIDFGAAVDMCTGINFNPQTGMLDPRYRSASRALSNGTVLWHFQDLSLVRVILTVRLLLAMLV